MSIRHHNAILSIISVCQGTSFPHVFGGNPCLKTSKKLDSGQKNAGITLKDIIFGQTLISVIIICLNFPAYAQISDTVYEDSLCEYTWNSDINECPDVLDCIHPLDWNDTVILVQKNITHISKHGFKLCVSDLNLVEPAEIIYIMDLSSSMNPASDPNPGDPYKKRPDALQAGFSFQIDSACNSLAGYIGFHQELQSDQLLPLVKVNTAAGINALNQMVQVLQTWVDDHEDDDFGFSTNYRNAIQKALEYFCVSGVPKGNTQAIVFVSDGEPYPSIEEAGATAGQIDTLIANGIPIHGVFLSNNNSPNTHLADIAQQTNGSITHVPPTNTDTLAKVVKNIISSLIDPFKPTGLSISNLATGSTAKAVNFDEINDSIWSAEMNKTVALKPDLNEIMVTMQLQSVSGIDTTLSFRFYIDVGGDPGFTSECYNCWYRTQLKVLVNNVEVDTLTGQNDTYTVQLEYYGIDTLGQVDVVAKTTQKGDYEVITITDWTYDGEKFIYSKTVPFAVLNPSQNATSDNGTTESGYNDLVTLAWQHPEEVMDTAYTEVVVSTPPNRMEIHSTPGQPTAATKYATSPAVDTIPAGIIIEFYAKIFTKTTWLDDYENNPVLSKLIRWDIVDAATGLPDPSIGTLAADTNSHNSFLTVKAYHTMDISAYLDVSGIGTVKETIRFYIKPGAAKIVVIENTNDINQTQDLNNPCHWTPIEIFGNQTDITAYAILRDSRGNWVGPAVQALWSVDDQTVVTVDPGPDDEGVVHKATSPSGQTLIHAAQNAMDDTAIVITHSYDIDAIRLVRILNGDTADISDLVMNSNQDTTLHVIGRRTDFQTWILLSASWGIEPLATEQNPPAAAAHWFFSPSRPETGIIYADFSGNSDTVSYRFTAGSPVQVSFDIITPDSLFIAGDYIQGVVRLLNEDGLVPGIWKYEDATKAVYTDVLSDGADDPVNPIYPHWEPFCRTSQDSAVFMNKVLSISQWITNGLDTVGFVLYYAPVDESPHQFTVKLGDLSATTNPFILKPGTLDTIVVTPDTLPEITPQDPSFIIVARGYDGFGNKRPNEIYTWNNDQTLVDFNINAQSSQIFIDPSNATKTQQGYIHVTGISNPSVVNKVFLKVRGALPFLLRALTRDYTGNGYLDVIELYYNKPVTLPPNYDPSYIIVQKSLQGNVYFKVDDFTVAPLGDGKKLLVHLNEENKSISNGDAPETGWTPYLTIDDCDSIKIIDRVKCADGAGPVIWQAGYASDITKDEIIVILSEHFYNYNGSPFLNAGPRPDGVFNTWVFANNTFSGIDSILSGVVQFQKQQGRWATFNMTNGQILTPNHYLNVDHIDGFVADKEGNLPNVNNQKVRITNNVEIKYIPETVTSLIAGISAVPNPADKQGSVLFAIDVKKHHDGLLCIYDAAGNVIDEIKVPSGSNSLTWDLRNRNRKKVSSGSYLVVFRYTENDTGMLRLLKLVLGVKEQ